jgi:hypothetical protein
MRPFPTECDPTDGGLGDAKPIANLPSSIRNWYRVGRIVERSNAHGAWPLRKLVASAGPLLLYRKEPFKWLL